KPNERSFKTTLLTLAANSVDFLYPSSGSSSLTVTTQIIGNLHCSASVLGEVSALATSVKTNTEGVSGLGRVLSPRITVSTSSSIPPSVTSASIAPTISSYIWLIASSNLILYGITYPPLSKPC